MSIHANPGQFDQTSLPFGCGFGETPSCFIPRKAIRSVVEDTTLGSFIYLKGLSERRYVFSAINAEQAGLYTHALFACVNEIGVICALNSTLVPIPTGCRLYVHVMEGDSHSHMETMADLAVAAGSV